eukprot:gene31373-40759_t
MNQANQKVVVQNANMRLIAIRQAEVAYFSNFFGNFGTQAAIMLGFICGSVSQVPGLDSSTDFFWVALYWLTTALTLACAMHVLVCTVFINVFGQGLALRGPLGSMIQAVNGMVIEQKQVVNGFIMMMIMFALQMIGLYWIMMDSISAIINTIITLLGMYVWYSYCLRIYNRFYWDQSTGDKWQGFSADDEGGAADLDELSTLTEEDPAVAIDIATGTTPNRTISSSSSNDSYNAKKESKVKLDSSSGAIGEDQPNLLPHSEVSGSLSLKEHSRISKEYWTRKFFLLKGSQLFYYTDRAAFIEAPGKPLNRRPLDLSTYMMKHSSTSTTFEIILSPCGDVSEDDAPQSDVSDNESDVASRKGSSSGGGGSRSTKLGKEWHLRCDTFKEFEYWVQVFARWSKLTDKNLEIAVDLGIWRSFSERVQLKERRRLFPII